MPCPDIKKKLTKLIMQEGISGASIHDKEKKIIIYIENESVKKAVNLAMFQGYEIEFRVQRFNALRKEGVDAPCLIEQPDNKQ